MNPYIDLYLVGDIYSRGSWAAKPVLNYRYRYHYSGTFKFSYAVNRLGQADSPDFSNPTDFSVNWVHTQDAKARPHSTFSANVNNPKHELQQIQPGNEYTGLPEQYVHIEHQLQHQLETTTTT